MQKARKSLANQFAKNKVEFCTNHCYASFRKKAFYIEFCAKWRKWFFTQHEQNEPRARNSTSSTFHFIAFWVTPAKWFKFHKVPILPSLFKLCKSFPSCQQYYSLQVSEKNDSCSVQKWFKVHKVRILPSLFSQTLQIISLLPNQFEFQTRDSSFRRCAPYLQF